jgi:hypothetical protein
MDNNSVTSMEEATTKADYYASIACRAILTAIESELEVDKYTRKIVLDAINDLKRNLVRYIYKVA